MRLIAEMPADLAQLCRDTFKSLDKDGNGTITLEDSVWAKPVPNLFTGAAHARITWRFCHASAQFIEAHDLDNDGKVTLNEYLYACSRQIAEDPGWTPTVAMLSHGSKSSRSGKYAVVGLKGAGKKMMVQKLNLGKMNEDAGVFRLKFEGLVRGSPASINFDADTAARWLPCPPQTYCPTPMLRQELLRWDLPGKRGDFGYEDELANLSGLVPHFLSTCINPTTTCVNNVVVLTPFAGPRADIYGGFGQEERLWQGF
eukprot:SAG31_NODE_1124_length_9772_cov_11.331541_13_plen_257_part_00